MQTAINFLAFRKVVRRHCSNEVEEFLM